MPPKKKTTLTPLPEGWILTDMERKDWRLGKIIGRGGFGLIYLASQRSDAPVPDDSPFVIKVEYYENGPLFSELKFYQRAAKQESLQKWRKSQRLDFLGVPTYWGYGMSEFQGRRYRFMVLDRLGTDLQKVCDGNGGRLKRQTVLRLGCLLLDALEYIHDNEYVHADVKAANLLLDYKDPSKVYLADYGLSYRYCPKGVHKEYKENPKIRHNGTIEYTSMDAHNGVAPSRRGDLEVLGYCLLHWLCGRLPWDSVLKNPLLVQKAKAELMANLPDSVLQLSPSDSSTGEVAMLLQCVKTLAYKERPNYQALRDVLAGGLLRTELKGSPLDLGPGGPPSLKMQTKAKPAVKEERLKPVAWETGDDELCGGTSPPSASAQVCQAKTSARPSYPRTERQRVSQARSAARQEPLQPEEARRVRWRESKKEEEEEEEDNLKPAAPEPRYSLRERPSGNWPLKLYSGTITVLFLCLLVLYAL